jgi:hypothetical protein
VTTSRSCVELVQSTATRCVARCPVSKRCRAGGFASPHREPERRVPWRGTPPPEATTSGVDPAAFRPAEPWWHLRVRQWRRRLPDLGASFSKLATLHKNCPGSRLEQPATRVQGFATKRTWSDRSQPWHCRRKGSSILAFWIDLIAAVPLLTSPLFVRSNPRTWSVHALITWRCLSQRARRVGVLRRAARRTNQKRQIRSASEDPSADRRTIAPGKVWMRRKSCRKTETSLGT